MGRFQIFRRNKDKQPQDVVEQPQALTFSQLVEQYGVASYEKQLRAIGLIGGKNWHLDLEKGIITFGNSQQEDELKFPVQLLGTYSHLSGTWIWSWERPEAGIADRALEKVFQILDFGKTYHVNEFITPAFAVDKHFPHLLGLVAVGIYDSSFYYCGDFGDGLVLVTVRDRLIDSASTFEGPTPESVFSQFIASFEVNHRRALQEYLSSKGYEVSMDGNILLAADGEDRIEAEFDTLDRVVKLNR